MAPNTMYGKVLFPEKIDDKEDRFNNAYFDRSVWFMEDLISGDVLDFCCRYLHFASYEELYDQIIRYFHEIKNPIRGLRLYDPVDGNLYMYHLVDNTKKRQLYSLVKPNQKRLLTIPIERMPRYYKNSNK